MKRHVIWTLALWLIAVAALAQEKEVNVTPPAGLRIEQTKFGLDLENREIVAETTTFHMGDLVYLWMRVVRGPADPIQVTWTSDDFTETAQLPIGGSPWRTWAKKTLFQPGTWTVKVASADGTELWSTSLTVAEAVRP